MMLVIYWKEVPCKTRELVFPSPSFILTKEPRTHPSNSTASKVSLISEVVLFLVREKQELFLDPTKTGVDVLNLPELWQQLGTAASGRA